MFDNRLFSKPGDNTRPISSYSLCAAVGRRVYAAKYTKTFFFSKKTNNTYMAILSVFFFGNYYYVRIAAAVGSWCVVTAKKKLGVNTTTDVYMARSGGTREAKTVYSYIDYAYKTCVGGGVYVKKTNRTADNTISYWAVTVETPGHGGVRVK